MGAARTFLKAGWHNQRGNVALMFGVMLVPIIGASGVAIDYQAADNTRSVLQAESDAAALEVMKTAVDIHTSPANATKTMAERNAMIEARAAQILTARQSIVRARLSTDRVLNVAMTGQWDDALKTEYKFTARAEFKRYIKVAGIGSSDPTLPVAVTASAKMDVAVTTTTSTPKIANPGYEAGDYNRIYAYCYDDSKKNDANHGRSQMTPVSSNGTHGNGNTPEMQTNNVFKSVTMPVCGTNETLSWRLYNVRDQRTTPSKWPKDDWNKDTKLWEQTDRSGVTIYNHYSDTKFDANGMEAYAFTGAAFGMNEPIRMMETMVCDTMDQCTPGKAGALTPSGKNRNPVGQNRVCEPGKFMYIGWEDRPFLPKNKLLNDFSVLNSLQWTDSDYDDITLVVSCPEKAISQFKTKIWLAK